MLLQNDAVGPQMDLDPGHRRVGEPQGGLSYKTRNLVGCTLKPTDFSMPCRLCATTRPFHTAMFDDPAPDHDFMMDATRRSTLTRMDFRALRSIIGKQRNQKSIYATATYP